MSSSSGDIIIKGGSCEIYFDDGTYETDPSDPKNHKNAVLKIKRVTISGDSHFKDVDTGEHPDGFKGTIKVYCE